ncbi:MAG: cobalamin biosynthesis protein CobQ [Richelia sp. RM2_1_2]|nr:cobalamin biosynthesis protein CobQ [Richelia sp. RM1_1_1]NJO30957.1 cobalamin biosynthesis protein CobQ [Richelia sp. SL_2_1]NJO64107.1 cobalamin biosynthesis protein CobQ [Richelia sp. RM2_1_2]
MSFRKVKRTRGRPRKTSLTLTQENQDNNNSEKSTMDNNELPTNEKIENWDKEIDGSEVNKEITEPPIPINETSKVETSPSGNNSEEQAPTNGFVRVEKESRFKEPTTIHIIDGEKGGCGKSFFCRTFIEYCNSIAYDVAIVDADTSNKDIAKIYSSVEVAFFSDDEKLASEADKIFDLAFEKSVLVNLPAQVYSNVTNWIRRNDLVNLGKDNSIKFIKWFVCTGGVDSVNFFLKSLNDLGDDIIHVFVRNQGLCDDWEYINQMPEFQSAISDYNFIIMDFPKFPFWERNVIDRLEINFSMAIAHPEMKVVPKQRVKNFLKEAYASFAATELIQ